MGEITVRRLGPADLDLLSAIPEGLFDHPVDRAQARAFLEDPQHDIVVAFEGELAVAFASGTVLLHPDKAPGFFVNEVGTRESHLRRGLATAVSEALFDVARKRGCEGIWLGTEPFNAPALGLYRKLGGEEQVFVGFAWDGAFDED
ncbi:MAG: GNAT family N-acetyltransferase [Deltaproteobacteria bacterium]|nr:GNAT family N-acetyltransferase [Deltaproteobacteria bacterium]